MSYRGTEITYLMGDITKPEGIDAIVNAANTHLARGGGVCGAIYKAAGPELDKATDKLGGCKTDEAKITDAYNIPCKKIIHTPGPVWQGGTHIEEMLLHGSYYNSLRVATRNGMRSVAFPSISTGIFGYPLDLAAKTAVEAVKNYIYNNPGKLDKVVWIFSSEDTAKHYIPLIEEANKADEGNPRVIKPVPKTPKVDPKDYIYKGKDILYLTTRGVMAYGKYDKDGKKFWVLKGSTICPYETNSCAKTVHAQREALFNDGTVKDGILTKDILFQGISRACSVISGGLGDGHNLWKNERGHAEAVMDAPHTIWGDRVEDLEKKLNENQRKVIDILADVMDTLPYDFFETRTVAELNEHFGGHDEMMVDNLVREYMIALSKVDESLDDLIMLVREGKGLTEIDKAIAGKIKGCVLGGAAGDALGYVVEFLNDDEIKGKYGSDGITSYDLDNKSGKALISDDTQMSLFTAVGVMCEATWERMIKREWNKFHKKHNNIRYPMWNAYADWKRTQDMSFDEWQNHKHKIKKDQPDPISWLLDVPGLFKRRAPGNTCMSSLEAITKGRMYGEFANNSSKGNGTVMRVAPYALHQDIIVPNKLSHDCMVITRVTHGHPMATHATEALAYLINQLVYPQNINNSLPELVKDMIAFISDDDLKKLIRKAVKLSKNSKSDIDNIRELGGGWVAEEALAISIYCSLKYSEDFSAGIIAAVNHDGDSDSTGAITGNILGAYLGFDAIDSKWKENLELYDVIMEVAEDLTNGCFANKKQDFDYESWNRKYIEGRWK